MKLQKVIEGCKQNDRVSQEKLYRQFYPGLFALCKKFFINNHDVLSALNDGMLIVFTKINQYDPEKGELFNWAYTIVRNAAIAQLKKNNQLAQTVEITRQLEECLDDNPFKELEWENIYFYLDKLPSATRAVCTLFYIEGFSIKEISEQLNVKTGTIKWHLSESRTRLKALFPQKQFD